MQKLLRLSFASLAVGAMGFAFKIEEYAIVVNLILLAGMLREIEKGKGERYEK